MLLLYFVDVAVSTELHLQRRRVQRSRRHLHQQILSESCESVQMLPIGSV